MKDILKLIRVKHWIKNLLIFLPLIFSGNLLNKNYLITTILGFLSFSLAASTIYIINDIKDKDKDKLHEIKKNRPIASGKISISKAIIIAVVLFILSFIFCILATKNIWSLSYLYILIYVLINIGYSLKLKNIPLVDITIIVIGFLLRVIFGASLLNIAISNWLYLTIISVSFYLALGKRRNEIIKAGSKSRTVLRYYTKEFLDKNMYMFLAISIVFYSLWTVDADVKNSMLLWTVPLIILILMRYSMNVESDSYGDPVEVILNDYLLLGLIIIYGIATILLLYI